MISSSLSLRFVVVIFMDLTSSSEPEVMATTASRHQARVSVCCEPGLYLGNSSCYAVDAFPAEIILPEIRSSNLSISSMSPDAFAPQYGAADCFASAVYNWHSDLVENVLIYLLENGTIYVNHSADGENWFDTENYCLASQMTENGAKNVVSVCLQPHYLTDMRNLIVNMVLPILSIPFVVAIFVIHAVLQEMRNVQGQIFRSYLAALLIMFVTTAEITADPRCLSVIIITLQFSLLASFFWMTVMAFDIWWTFGGFGTLQRNTKLEDKKKIIIYSCYAWGVPALITGIGVVLDFLRVESTILIRPGINVYCRFTSKAAHDIYATAPVSSTMILNIFFFASTAIKIMRQKKAAAEQLGGTDSRRHDDKNKERFNLYLKLFIVMGISRLAGLMAWRYYDQLPDYIFYSLAIEGSLQGPIVFVIYVWKKNTKQMLLKRVESLNKMIRRMNSDSSESRSDSGKTTATVTISKI